MSSVGLYSRKKRDEFGSADVVKGLDQSPSSGGLDRSHRRRRNPLSRFLRSEVGCALEMVLAFLVVGLLMGYVILGHQKRKVILHIMNDPIGHGAALKGRSGFRHHFYTGHPRSVTVVLPSVVNPEKRPRRLESIAETWGPAARAVFVVHNISEFPSASNAVISSDQTPEDQYSYPQLMLAPDSIGPDDGVPRLIWVLRMVHERINPDFALFVNDHTFVVTEHLCKYLEPMNPNDHMYHGHALKNNGLVFNSGAAGYILSRETMKKLVHLFDAGDPLCTGKSASKWLQGNPALLTTQCMNEKLGVVPVDTRNRQSKNGVPQHRFHAFPLTRSVSLDVDQWYINKHEGMDELMPTADASYNTLLGGVDCCAQDTLTFHYVEYAETRALFAVREALLRHPKMTDHDLKGYMIKEWPNTQKEIGGYSRPLPKESDKEQWKSLLQVVRKVSSRHTQGEC